MLSDNHLARAHASDRDLSALFARVDIGTYQHAANTRKVELESRSELADMTSAQRSQHAAERPSQLKSVPGMAPFPSSAWLLPAQPLDQRESRGGLARFDGVVAC